MDQNRYIEFQKTRDFGTIIGDTFDFIIKNIKPFAKNVLIIMIPNFLLIFLWIRMYGPNYFLKMNAENLNFLTPTFWILMLLGIVLGLLYMVLIVCVNYDYIKLYIDKNGAEISLGELWSSIKSDFFRILLSLIGLLIFGSIVFGLIAGIIVILGTLISNILSVLLVFIAIFFVGPYLLIALWPVLFIVIYEKKNVISSIFRSFQLIYGKWWFTFGLFIVIMFVWMLLATIVSIPYYILVFAFSFHAIENINIYIYPLFAVSAILLSFFGAFMYMIPQTAIALHYFNLKERKEASSLFVKVENI